jgi:hypothetical protein
MKTTGTAQKVTAASEFVLRLAEMEELIARMSDYIENHGDLAPEEVTWAHVGTASAAIDMMRNVVEFIES